jgi:DNA-binding NtrC family response regulator
METGQVLKRKRVLIVDDEEDVLDQLTELLDMCKIDRASTFEEAKEHLERDFYDAAILDIMGVRGYELLEIANKKKIPTLMLTAHALSSDNLKKSFQKGASYYVPKDEIGRIDVFLADILEARDMNRNVWVRWYERLGGFCDKRFGPNWREEDPEFWDSLLKY